jgi:hypothetical protein
MRKLMFILSLIAAPCAYAQDTSCSQSQTVEAKTACLDNLMKQQSHCISIQDTDSKNLCLAQVKQQKSYCFSIQSSDIRTICFDVFK